MDRRKFASSALLTALAIAAAQMPSEGFGESLKTAATSDISGKCYGIVGAHEGECGGRNPATGETWGCAGQNPTADLGWKQLKKSQCDATPKHKDASEKKFVADKA